MKQVIKKHLEDGNILNILLNGCESPLTFEKFDESNQIDNENIIVLYSPENQKILYINTSQILYFF